MVYTRIGRDKLPVGASHFEPAQRLSRFRRPEALRVSEPDPDGVAFGRCLPEQRAELYESILVWLARAREKAGRERAETCLRLLGQLALGMQTESRGRNEVFA